MTTTRKKRTTRRRIQIGMGMAFLLILGLGWRWSLLGFFIPLCMLLGIGIGLVRGRKWCDWLCPRGSFYDALIAPISPSRPIPKVFKGLPLRLFFMALLMAMMTVQLIRRWPDPYAIGAFFVMLLTVTTVFGIVLAVTVHQRAWCCVCPIGTMANWAGRWKHPLRIDSERCTECNACRKVCPMDIAPLGFKRNALELVRDADCLKCGLCVAVCPVNALHLGSATTVPSGRMDKSSKR